MTLQDKIYQINEIQGRRFGRLPPQAQLIATEGIVRHMRACASMKIDPDLQAIREIMDDAVIGRRVFAETSNDQVLA